MKRNRVLTGDARTRLRELPESCVDTVCTSPPYFQLRDYGARGQIGTEDSADAWASRLRAVATELARVLKPGGTWWLNLGDSFSRGGATGVPAKGLLLAPERLLLGLAEDGWLIRNKVVWHKPNPVPTSARDRLNTTWEPIYLLTRAPDYYFDLDAIRVPHITRSVPAQTPPSDRPSGRPDWAGPLAGDQHGLALLRAEGRPGHPLGKNPGDVWQFAPTKRRGACLAPFPEGLVERTLRASCPVAVCRQCQRPWLRPVTRSLGALATKGELAPDCACEAPSRPGLVLDPFLGSGTTAVVAQRLGLDWLGIELRPDFARAAAARLRAERTTGKEAA